MWRHESDWPRKVNKRRHCSSSSSSTFTQTNVDNDEEDLRQMREDRLSSRGTEMSRQSNKTLLSLFRRMTRVSFVRLVLAQRMFEMYSLRNDAEREERQRIRENAVLSRVSQSGSDRSSFVSPFRHYPQPKPTVVANNPEMQRIRLLTDIQSNVRFVFFPSISTSVFSRRNITKISTRAKESSRRRSSNIPSKNNGKKRPSAAVRPTMSEDRGSNLDVFSRGLRSIERRSRFFGPRLRTDVQGQ